VFLFGDGARLVLPRRLVRLGCLLVPPGAKLYVSEARSEGLEDECQMSGFEDAPRPDSPPPSPEGWRGWDVAGAGEERRARRVMSEGPEGEQSDICRTKAFVLM